MAHERRDERLLHAEVDLREPGAQGRPAHDMRPELEEHRQPPVVPAAPPRRGERERVEPAARPAAAASSRPISAMPRSARRSYTAKNRSSLDAKFE